MMIMEWLTFLNRRCVRMIFLLEYPEASETSPRLDCPPRETEEAAFRCTVSLLQTLQNKIVSYSYKICIRRERMTFADTSITQLRLLEDLDTPDNHLTE